MIGIMPSTKTKEIKRQQLGMDAGTAQSRLRKMLLFRLAGRLGLTICYRCGRKISSCRDLSIDHKVDWLHSASPKDVFFDLENIAFSHLKCNVAAARKCHSVISNKHGTKGIFKRTDVKRKKPYRVTISMKNPDGVSGRAKYTYVGDYVTLEEASAAYDAAAEDIFGYKAITNKSILGP